MKPKPKVKAPDELRLECDLATLLKKGERGKYAKRTKKIPTDKRKAAHS